MTRKVSASYEFINGTRVYTNILQAIAGFALQLRDQAGNQRLVVSSTGVHLGTGTVSAGGGIGVVGIGDASTIPTSNPSGGVILYSDSGVAKVRQPDGTIIPIALASSSGDTFAVFMGG